METVEITKNGTLDMTFYKPEGEANMYVRFGYVPLTIFYHTREQVSGSIYADPINMIHTSQQSTIKGLKKDFEGGFTNSKEQYLVDKL